MSNIFFLVDYSKWLEKKVELTYLIESISPVGRHPSSYP